MTYTDTTGLTVEVSENTGHDRSRFPVILTVGDKAILLDPYHADGLRQAIEAYLQDYAITRNLTKQGGDHAKPF